MTQTDPYCALLDAVRATYDAHPALPAFAPFPADLSPQDIQPVQRRACNLMRTDPSLTSTDFDELQAAIHMAAPAMLWRETYKGNSPETRFMDRWGCFSIVGEGGPFASAALRIFVVYMPARLFYPWHSHPAEELYVVLAGQATFRRRGHADETLREGQTMYHATNEVHAIETFESPVLCLVVWRNHLNTPPVLVAGSGD